MARAKARKTELKTDATPDAGTAVADHAPLPPGATDFNPAELEAAHTNGHSSRLADERAERQQQAQTRDAERAVTQEGGHAERPKARSTEMITDAAAKMSLHSNHENYRMAITFSDGKPSEAVRETLKDAGFRWSQDDKAWEKPTGYETRVRDRIDAERTFEAVAEMRKEEMGAAVQR